MIYRPMYVDKVMDYVDTPFVKVLAGVRRCGKSTILKMIMEKLQAECNGIVSCRYESMEYEDMTAALGKDNSEDEVDEIANALISILGN